MSIARKQVEHIIQDIVKGYVQMGMVPTIGMIRSSLARHMRDIRPGEPTFKARHQEGRSDIVAYNANIDELVNDLNIYYEEAIDQVTAILQHLNAAETEFVVLDADVHKLMHEVGSLLKISKDTDGYVYAVYDAFRDFDGIDMARTSSWVSTHGDSIKLGVDQQQTHNVVPYHYFKTKKADDFKVVQGASLVREQSMTIDSSFGNIFKDQVSTCKWQLYADKPGAITCSFSFKVDVLGSSVPMNTVEIIPHSPKAMRVSLHYKNSYTNDWKDLPTYEGAGRTVDAPTCWQVDVSKLATIKGEAKTPEEKKIKENPGISHIKVFMNKVVEDSKEGPMFLYEFGIKHIGLRMMHYKTESTIQTTSQQFVDFQDDPLTIDKVALEVDQFVPQGTSVHYYVGADRWIDGSFTDGTDLPVPEDSVNVSGFVYGSPIEEVNCADTSGVLQSELRKVGISGYGVWEPTWKKITPVGAAPIADTSGILGPHTVAFDTSDPYEGPTGGWTAPSEDRTGYIDIYSIYDFEKAPIPATLKVRQGKGFWTYNIYDDPVYATTTETIHVSGFATSSPSGYWITVGPSGTSPMGEDPMITVSGAVGPAAFRHYGIDPDNYLVDEQGIRHVKDRYTPVVRPEEHFKPGARTGDYTVRYFDDGSAAIIVNQEAIDEKRIYEGQELTFDVTYKEGTYRELQTYAFVQPNMEASGVLTLADMVAGRYDRVDVSLVDPETGQDTEKMVSSSHNDTEWKVKLGEGWNRITVKLAKDILLGDITMPQITAGDIYAWMEPLIQKSKHGLQYNTHRNDHRFFAVDGAKLWVNDFGQGPVDLVSSAGTSLDTIQDVPDAAGVSDAYDLSYKSLAKPLTNIILKAVLRTSNPAVTPSIRNYMLKAGYKVNENG